MRSDNGKVWYLEGILQILNQIEMVVFYGQELWEREVDKYNSDRISHVVPKVN